MIEEELRAAFARHEAETPAAGPLRDKINIAFVRRKRRRAAARAAGVATAVLVAAGVVPIALAERRPATVAPQSLLASRAPARPVSTGALNILLLGTDPGSGGSGDRADSVLVLHVPADRRHAYLISLPGDARVPIPGHGTDDLDTSLAYGGAALSRRVVAQVTGLAIATTVVVDTTALARITDAVGGVELCLDQSFTSTRNGKHYRAGCQQLKGSDVVPVLRARRQLTKGGSDADRDGQRFLAALARKLASSRVLTDPKALHSMLTLIGRNGLTVAGSVDDLIGVARTMRSAAVVGISEPSPAAGIYPNVGRSLFAATRADDLDEWVAAHPSYVLKS
jgi:LCP family protein required for cell wall assembly